MGYKSIVQILLILAIISTICISIMKPKMHKPVIVYNSQFSFNSDSSSKIDETNIPVLVQNANVSQNNNIILQNQTDTDINQIPANFGNTDESKILNSIPVSSQNVNFTNTNSSSNGFKNKNVNLKQTNVKNSNTKLKTASPNYKNNKISNTGTKIDLNRIVQNNQKIINTPVTADGEQPTYVPPVRNKSIPQHTSQTTKPSIRLSSNTTTSQPKYSSDVSSSSNVMSAQEEEIAWNKWRSNLNNQIMKDSKLPTMPNGIVFKYKFTVDKYGKVSNVQTSSTTPGYTPYAIQFIAPVIRSYQGRSILNFPAGSNRVTTVVSGAWRISNTSKYSTPDDYNDIEKVKR